MIEMSYKIGSCWEFVKVIILGWDSGGGMLTVVTSRGKRPVTDAGTLGQVDKLTEREPPWRKGDERVKAWRWVCVMGQYGAAWCIHVPPPRSDPPPLVCQDLLPLICMVLPFWFRHCRSVICRCILSFIICEKKNFFILFSSLTRSWGWIGWLRADWRGSLRVTWGVCQGGVKGKGAFNPQTCKKLTTAPPHHHHHRPRLYIFYSAIAAVTCNFRATLSTTLVGLDHIAVSSIISLSNLHMKFELLHSKPVNFQLSGLGD